MVTGSGLVFAVYAAVLCVLSLFGAHRLAVVYLYWRYRRADPVPPQMDSHPFVTVQVPVFNEIAVVERVIDAVCSLRWPRERFEVQILDDSTDATVEICRAAVARWSGRGVQVSVVSRGHRTGFKAGALALGLERAKGDFIAVFDADFVPSEDFLEKTVPHLHCNDRAGMVQARWVHLNEAANLLTKASALLLDGHFALEHAARCWSGRFFNFNGTAGLWRRECIEDAGGWSHDTLVEDLDLSYRAQLRGWEFVYLQDVTCPAELPGDVRAFKVQQHRWAKGTLQAARKLLPAILRSSVRPAVKVEASVHLLLNLAYPLVVALALVLPVQQSGRAEFDSWSWVGLDAVVFGLACGSVGIFYMVAASAVHGRWWNRVWRIPLVMALGVGVSVSQTTAVIAGLFGRDVTFRRTPKSGSGDGAPASMRYRPRCGWAPWVELILCAHLTVGAWQNGYAGAIGATIFCLLFAFGFGFMGLGSILPVAWMRRMPSVQPRFSVIR